MSNSILTAPEWLQYGLTSRVTGDNDPKYGQYGTINKTPRTLWQYMQALGVSLDSIRYTWKDANTLTVKANIVSVCWADDLEQGYQIDTDTDVDCSSLSAGTIYFLWIGDVSGVLTITPHTSATTPPGGLDHAHRLYGWIETDGSGDVIQFDPALDPLIARGVPTLYCGQYAPLGCLTCEGQEQSRTDPPWSWLYALIGTTYGVGDGSTTYNLPDYRGRSPLGSGQGSGLTDRSRGDSGGEEEHTSIIDEMPAHDHQESSNLAGSGTTGIISSTVGASYAARDVWTQSTGSGNAYNIMHPYLVSHVIIRV